MYESSQCIFFQVLKPSSASAKVSSEFLDFLQIRSTAGVAPSFGRFHNMVRAGLARQPARNIEQVDQRIELM